MLKTKGTPSWSEYISGSRGENGFYIKEEKNDKDILFGPFIKSTNAEFFNYLAYCSPYDFDADIISKNGIIYIKQGISNSKKKKLFLHPKYLCFESSKFNIWWKEIYGIELTQNLVLKIAKECKAKGYIAFRDWMLNGSKIGSKAIHCLLL